MKLVFLKDNIVVNTVVAPQEGLKEYEQAILERGSGSLQVDMIMHVEDDCYVGIGFKYNGKQFSTETEDSTIKTTPEESYVVDAANIDQVTDDLIK